MAGAFESRVEAAAMDAPTIGVEVAYALPERQSLLRIRVPRGTTAAQAVQRSGILERYPEIDPGVNKLGIFAKVVPGERVLREGDRVEIYRALIADPKAVRKQRAEEGKRLKKGGGALRAEDEA